MMKEKRRKTMTPSDSALHSSFLALDAKGGVNLSFMCCGTMNLNFIVFGFGTWLVITLISYV
jgi:hypothetical protein